MDEFDKIAVYSSHDANICYKDSSGYRVIEYERISKERFGSILKAENPEKEYKKIYDIIKLTRFPKFQLCYDMGLDDNHKNMLRRIFGIQQFVRVFHHQSHAKSAFYQSNFDKALVISYDGGGMDELEGENRITFFNFFEAHKDGNINKIKVVKYDLGTAYGFCGVPISEIKKQTWGENFLSYPGKLMGLVAYGNVNPKWLAPMRKFFIKNKPLREDTLDSLGTDIGLNLRANNLSGQVAYDFAATAQKAFEYLALEEINKILSQYKNWPVVLTGGCALNVILNEKLRKQIKQLYVPPNPSDCGLSFGMFTYFDPPKDRVDLTYAGAPILDIEDLEKHKGSRNGQETTPAEIAQKIAEGKIIGLIHGNSEHGPRALGNRSILCNPSILDMKNILNNKVKFREWFRPFAPVALEEKAGQYFDFEGEARYMSFSPEVKDEYKDKLPAIVHKDGTARLQTIREDQNKYLYDIIVEFEKITGYPILLNTSFNIKGKPILTTIEDALYVLDNTDLDIVVVENIMFIK